MSNFTKAAYHPKEKVIRAAMWLDDHFGPHRYGVRFKGDDKVYLPEEVEIPLDQVFEARQEKKKPPEGGPD